MEPACLTEGGENDLVVVGYLGTANVIEWWTSSRSSSISLTDYILSSFGVPQSPLGSVIEKPDIPIARSSSRSTKEGEIALRCGMPRT